MPKAPTPRQTPPGRRRRKSFSFIKNLILYWPLHDGPGSNAKGGAANQSVANPAFTSASIGGAMQFQTFGAAGPKSRWRYDPLVGGYCYNNDRNDGGAGNAQVSMATNASNSEINTINLALNWTVAIRAYFPTFASSAGFGPVLFTHSDGTKLNFYLQALGGTNPPHTLRAAFTTANGGTTNAVDGTTLLQKRRWYFLVGTYDGAHLKCYVDGKLDGSVALAVTPDTTGVTGRWVVGNISGIAGANFEIRGYLCEAMVFNKALNLADIRSIWLDPLADPPGIISDGGPIQGGNPLQPNILFGQSARPIVSTNYIAGYPDPD